ncbi:hypothetical protein D9M68_638750 [compost metagenome]
MLKPPSPKAQLHEVALEELSWNCTVNGTHPEAEGLAAAFTDTLPRLNAIFTAPRLQLELPFVVA